MTDERRAALVKNVARLMQDMLEESGFVAYEEMASAVLDPIRNETLEEAARVAENVEYDWAYELAEEQRGYAKAGPSPSAEIRALIAKEPHTPA